METIAEDIRRMANLEAMVRRAISTSGGPIDQINTELNVLRARLEDQQRAIRFLKHETARSRNRNRGTGLIHPFLALPNLAETRPPIVVRNIRQLWQQNRGGERENKESTEMFQDVKNL